MAGEAGTGGGPRTGPFETEFERIAWLVAEVEARPSGASVSPHEADLEVFAVTGSWLARCLSLVKGVAALLREGLNAPACVLRRAVWEIWIDWRYLLRAGDRRLNAAKVLLTAQVATAEALRGRLNVPAEGAARALERSREHNPVAWAAVEEQRARRHFHWSGRTYSAMERELAGGLGGIYGPLSWEVHGTVTAMRDVRLELGRHTAIFRFGQTDEAYSPESLLYSVGGVLFYVYNDFADLWGLAPIDLRKSP